MPREILIPRRVVDFVVGDSVSGTSVLYPVTVDWPELQLTEEQQLANAAAWVTGRPLPYPDLSIISIRLER